MQPTIELTVRYGQWAEKTKTVALPIDERLMRELMEPVELSDQPLSLFLASPGMYGGKGNAIEKRQRTFKMRREVAKDIARAMVPALIEAFGGNDQVDGYRRDQLQPDDPALRRAEAMAQRLSKG